MEDPLAGDEPQPCPNCGQVHTLAQWKPNSLAIDRDITAIVAALLNEGTVRDYAELVGDEDRMPAMLLRSCQYIAQLFMMLAHMNTPSGSHEEAVDLAQEMLGQALLMYAEGKDPND